MSSTDPRAGDEFASIFHDCLVAEGEVPVTDDLQGDTATVRLFRQWEEYVRSQFGGGGGDGAILGQNIGGITAGATITTDGFNMTPLPSGYGTLAGVNPFVVPVPPALPFPGLAFPGTVVLEGPAVPAFSFSADPLDVSAITPVAGPFGPNSFALEIVTAGTATGPTIVEFAFEGQLGIIVLDFAII